MTRAHDTAWIPSVGDRVKVAMQEPAPLGEGAEVLVEYRGTITAVHGSEGDPRPSANVTLDERVTAASLEQLDSPVDLTSIVRRGRGTPPPYYTEGDPAPTAPPPVWIPAVGDRVVVNIDGARVAGRIAALLESEDEEYPTASIGDLAIIRDEAVLGTVAERDRAALLDPEAAAAAASERLAELAAAMQAVPRARKGTPPPFYRPARDALHNRGVEREGAGWEDRRRA